MNATTVYGLRLLVLLFESDYCTQIILNEENHETLQRLVDGVTKIQEYLPKDEFSIDRINEASLGIDISYVGEIEDCCNKLYSILHPCFNVLAKQGLQPFVHILDNLLGHKPLVYVFCVRFSAYFVL